MLAASHTFAFVPAPPHVVDAVPLAIHAEVVVDCV